jgi:CRISPR-associated endonuclease/helicase Cas3
MTHQYYAHTLEGKPPSEWQPLEEHLQNVANLARGFAAHFGSGDLAYLGGLWHDLGKYQEQFQQRLMKVTNSVDHSIVGALHARESFEQCKFPCGTLLAYLIAGHHTGLPDWVHEIGSGGALSNKLEKQEILDRVAGCVPNSIVHQLQPKLIPPGGKPLSDEHLHLWVRMLFACLVDADFLDTEAFVEPEKSCQRGGYPSLMDLRDRFDAYMNRKQTGANDSPINRNRRTILSMCRKKALEPPGFFSLTVPTGGGKTLSSMAFSLDHAVYHGKRRIIVAIPYTSIIEQTAGVYKEVFGEENVLEHHSNLDPERETFRNRLAAENWDVPIIVTTNVQLFESLFASRTSAVRKLHNLSDSVIILDEAQMLPPEYLKPILSALRGIVRHFGVTVVLCTATQPALRGKIGSAPAQFEGLQDVVEIAEDPKVLADNFTRVEISFPGAAMPPSSWEEIALDLQEQEQVLCIVNSRKDCRELHALMPSGTIHLSALMCAEERSEVICVVKSKLRDGEPVRVISTQLVEAGVDVDFPMVYRAMAGFDSVAQAAGRCNREGKLNQLGRLGKVVVFEPPRAAPPGLLRKGQDAGREVLRTNNVSTFSPALYKIYFELFYGRVNNFDKPRFYESLVTDARSFHFQFRTFAGSFHLIDDMEQKGVAVWYRGGKADSQKLIESLRSKGPERGIMRKLQRFIVNIPKRLHDALMTQGLIEDIHGYSVQACPGLYREGLGLLHDDVRWDPEAFIQ